MIDVNYFCRLATIILAGPNVAEDASILWPVDLNHLVLGLSSFFVFSFLSKEDRLWECGNLAFCARFPSLCGNRSVVSIETSFP